MNKDSDNVGQKKGEHNPIRHSGTPLFTVVRDVSRSAKGISDASMTLTLSVLSTQRTVGHKSHRGHVNLSGLFFFFFSSKEITVMHN